MVGRLIDGRNPGLRERKKQRTREQIAATALRLFLERGFERVTVAEVARAAEVAEQTVFNYFPTKEDLVYQRLEGFEEGLLAVVRGRAPGEPALTAFRRYLLEQRGLLGEDDPAALERLAAINRMIAASPALLARERRVFDRYTDALATVLAEEEGARPDDIEAWVVANSLVGVHRALVRCVRDRVVAGEGGASLRAQVQAQADRAFDALARGLGGYGVRGTTG